MNVPKLRFSEFNDKWKNFLLKDVVNFENGRGHETIIDPNGIYTVINSKFISTQGETVIKKSNQQLVPLEKNDIVMVMSDLPNGKALAKCYFIEESNKYTLNQRICRLTVLKSFSSKFLYYLLDRNSYFLKFDDGVNQTNLRKEEIINFIGFAPLLKEQIKISDFLTLLNKKIELQSKKIEDLKLFTKKIIIDTLSDENNHNSKLFKDVCTIQTGKSNTQDKDENGTYPFYIRSENIEHSSKYIFDCEAVITIGDGNIGKVFFYENGKFDCHQRVYVLNNFKDVTGKFLYYYFSTFFYKRAISMSAKNTVDSVRMEMISDMKIEYPKIERQNELTKIFDVLEEKQKLEKLKLDKLINLKKGLMQSMFV